MTNAVRHLRAAAFLGSEEAGMKGWRKRAADVFADQGARAAK
jgi:hypothetical protein